MWIFKVAKIIWFGFRLLCFKLFVWLGIKKTHVSPCKTFRKKRMLACYSLLYNPDQLGFRHIEIFRIVNPKDGEYYLFTKSALQKKRKFHYSYHKSGAFHWREDGLPPISPAYGEADARSAIKTLQYLEYFQGQVEGYCLAIGPGITSEALERMLHILRGYIVHDLKEPSIMDYLLEHKNISLMLPIPWQRAVIQALVRNSIEAGKATRLSEAELLANLKEKVGADAQIIITEPQPKSHISVDFETMQKILSLVPKADMDQRWPIRDNGG